MIPFIRHKQGDTLTLNCVYKDADANPIDISGFSIKADILQGDVRKSLTVSIENAQKGEFTLSASATETNGWPLGIFEGDIKYITPQKVSSSETFQLHLIKQVTHAS